MFSFPSTAQLLLSRIHFGILGLFVFVLLLNHTESIRIFVYLNCIAVIGYIVLAVLEKKKATILRWWPVFLIPVGFTLVNFLAQGGWTKELRVVWLSAFLMVGVWTALKLNLSWFKKYYLISLLLLLAFFITVQFIVGLFGLHDGELITSASYSYISFGGYTNPHYFALYTVLLIPVTVGGVLLLQGKLRWLLLGALCFLLLFVLSSSSRPAWLALLSGGIVAIAMLRYRALAALIFGLVLALLYSANISHFADRTNDLIQNIQKEERVVIWHDSWEMQKNSSLTEWLVGHGIGSFQNDFFQQSKEYGNKKFRHPHNFFLEVLYASGIIGMGIMLTLYAGLLRKLYSSLWLPDRRTLVILLLSTLVIHFVMVFLTIPYFSRYYFYPLAFMGAAVFLLDDIYKSGVQ